MSKRPATEAENAEPNAKRSRQTILSNSLSPTTPSLPPNATISAPIEDRKSRFIGYFVPLTSSSQLARTKTLLESLPELALADHKIMAWKIGQSRGSDDDGEKWAGKKVLGILEAAQDEGLICVARWYGGIMLGPARFDHIEHVAADALATYHLKMNKSPVLASPSRMGVKMVAVVGEEEDLEKGRLVRVLKGKDMSIDSLRGMIVSLKVKRGEDSPPASPSKEKHYEKMQVEALRRLVIARDATIKSLRDIHKELSQIPEETEGSVREG